MNEAYCRGWWKYYHWSHTGCLTQREAAEYDKAQIGKRYKDTFTLCVLHAITLSDFRLWVWKKGIFLLKQCRESPHRIHPVSWEACFFIWYYIGYWIIELWVYGTHIPIFLYYTFRNYLNIVKVNSVLLYGLCCSLLSLGWYLKSDTQETEIQQSRSSCWYFKTLKKKEGSKSIIILYFLIIMTMTHSNQPFKCLIIK